MWAFFMKNFGYIRGTALRADIRTELIYRFTDDQKKVLRR